MEPQKNFFIDSDIFLNIVMVVFTQEIIEGNGQIKDKDHTKVKRESASSSLRCIAHRALHVHKGERSSMDIHI